MPDPANEIGYSRRRTVDAAPARGKSTTENLTAPRLLSAQAAARYLGVPYTSLRDWVFRGHLSVVRVPGCRRWWFDRRDLDHAIEAWKERGDC